MGLTKKTGVNFNMFVHAVTAEEVVLFFCVQHRNEKKKEKKKKNTLQTDKKTNGFDSLDQCLCVFAGPFVLYSIIYQAGPDFYKTVFTKSAQMQLLLKKHFV